MFILDGRELSLSKCDLHRFVVTLSHVGLCVTYSRPMCSLQCQIIFRKEATSQNIIDYVSPWVLLVGGPLKEVGASRSGFYTMSVGSRHPPLLRWTPTNITQCENVVGYDFDLYFIIL